MNQLSLTVVNMCALASVVLVAILLFRAFRQWTGRGLTGIQPLPLLLLLPFLQAVSAAMTSAKTTPDLGPAVGMMLLMLPISFPAAAAGLPEAVLASVAFVLTVYGAPMKAANPYHWHHYNSRPMFTEREWFQHPLYGPMYIEQDQLQLITKVCATVRSSSAAPELLSLPFPYPNYFCGVVPWHGNVQTWYDTASRPTVNFLLHQLEEQPPEWIAYERGLDTMATHEEAFLHGGKLPQRDIDTLIVNRVRDGAWSVPIQQCFGGADWLLVHTRPAKPGEQVESLIASSDDVNLCNRTNHGLKLP